MTKFYNPTVAAAALLCSSTVYADATGSSATGVLSQSHFAQVSLPVRNLDRSLAFYRDELGLKLLFRVPNALFFEVGGLRLRLEATDRPEHNASTLYFDDPGLASAAGLKAHGVKFEGPAETVQTTADRRLQILEFTDPDGNQLALMGFVPLTK